MKHKPDPAPDDEFQWWHFYDFADQQPPDELDPIQMSRFREWIAICTPVELEEFLAKQKGDK
jgi:hypothetical protein